MLGLRQCIVIALYFMHYIFYNLPVCHFMCMKDFSLEICVRDILNDSEIISSYFHREYIIRLWSMLCCLFSLKKNYHERPNYVQLLEHPFIVANDSKEVDVSTFVTEALASYGTKPETA